MSETPNPIEEIIARATYPNAWSEWGYQLPIQEARRAEAISAARHAIAALKGAGYEVVPIEPTEAILTKAGFLFPGSPSYEEGSQDYRDLVKAASHARKMR